MHQPFSFYFPLENATIRLRALVESDRSSILNILETEPELWRFSPSPVWTENERNAYFDAAIEPTSTHFSFAIESVETQKIIGSTRLYELNFSQKTTRIGYSWIVSALQGTGINQQAKYLLFEFVFEKLQFERIEFCVDERNAKSRAALLKIGCTQEGILRNHQYVHDGTRRNTVVFSILSKEWNKQQFN